MVEEVIVDMDAEFLKLAGPYRVELLAYCYRLLGSVADAEDTVQETYLRAWRSFGSFEGRSSVRTWLYRIATNSCLTARARAATRPLPSGLSGPRRAGDDEHLAPPDHAMTWLKPIPDTALDDDSADPATLVSARAGLRLALIAALQYLPGNQRAVFVLREVLRWRAREVADALEISVPAVNSLLQRARRRIREVDPDQGSTAEPRDPEVRRQVDRYADAFQRADVASLVALLSEDVTFEMPPIPTWFAGREAVGRFLGRRMAGPAGTWRFVIVAANTQPAVALYLRGDDRAWRAESLHVLTVTSRGISRIISFRDLDTLALFHLPAVHSHVVAFPGKAGE